MRERLKELLQRIATDEALEARWLNTLSLLEYVGARKIGRAVAHEHPDAEVLDHWADETRHAAAFKRLADEVAGARCRDYLAREAAEHYFQELDRRATSWVRELTGRDDAEPCYLLVTTLIERRAMTVYPLYRGITRQPAVRDELQRIVVEEQAHRRELEEATRTLLGRYGVEGLGESEEMERQLFEELLEAVDDELRRSSDAAHAPLASGA